MSKRKLVLLIVVIIIVASVSIRPILYSPNWWCVVYPGIYAEYGEETDEINIKMRIFESMPKLREWFERSFKSVANYVRVM